MGAEDILIDIDDDFLGLEVLLEFGTWRHSTKYHILHGKNSATCHLTFTTEIKHRLPQVTWTVTITPKGESRYIYIYHTQSNHVEQEHSVIYLKQTI